LRRLINQFDLVPDGSSAADGDGIENGGEAK
jgi:hypothetical protein